MSSPTLPLKICAPNTSATKREGTCCQCSAPTCGRQKRCRAWSCRHLVSECMTCRLRVELWSKVWLCWVCGKDYGIGEDQDPMCGVCHYIRDESCVVEWRVEDSFKVRIGRYMTVLEERALLALDDGRPGDEIEEGVVQHRRAALRRIVSAGLELEKAWGQ